MQSDFKNSNILFLCCQGRSGSTLLLRILNTINGCNIVGESKGALSDLVHFYQHIKVIASQSKMLTDMELTPYFTQDYGHWQLALNSKLNSEKAIEGIYDLFYTLFGARNSRIMGFKEIIVGFGSYEEFKSDMDSLKELFPNLKVIFLTRNMEELLNSRWWADDKEASRVTLTNQENYFSKYSEEAHSENNNWHYHLTYQDLSNKTPILINLFNFIGESFPEEGYKHEMDKVTR